MTFAATVLTLYPEMLAGPLAIAHAGRGLAEGKWALDAVQIRDFATDKHRTVDDTPAGGGAGMVLKADILAAACDSVGYDRPMLAMTPRGGPLTEQRVPYELAGSGELRFGPQGLDAWIRFPLRERDSLLQTDAPDAAADGSGR